MLGLGKFFESQTIGQVNKKSIKNEQKSAHLEPLDYESSVNELDDDKKNALERMIREDRSWKEKTIEAMGLPYFYEIIEKHQPLNTTAYKKILEDNLNAFLTEDESVKNLEGKVKINTCVGTSIDQIFGIDGFITLQDRNHSYDVDKPRKPIYINFDLTMNPNKTEARGKNKKYDIIILSTQGKEIGYGPNDDKEEFLEVVSTHMNILIREIHNKFLQAYSN